MPLFRRRQVLAASSLLAMPAIRRAGAQGKKRISFTLPWVAEGSNLVAYVAKGKGYWDEAGLDVQISRGYGSVGAAQAIGAGRFDFGLAAASAGIQQTASGLPVIAIACSGYDATMGICVLKDGPIQKPQDLAEKTLGSAPASGEYPYLPAYFRQIGIDPNSVKIQATDPNVRTRILIDKQVPAVSGFAISIAPVTQAAHVPVRFFLFSAAGLKQYNNMLLTTPAWLKKDPETCKAIADGLARANRDVLLDPEGAVDLFMRQVPEMALEKNGREVVKVGLGIYQWNMIQPPAIQHGIGYSAPDDYESMIDAVMRYAVGHDANRPSVDQVMTNQFSGHVTLTAAEWNSAGAKAATYRELLS